MSALERRGGVTKEELKAIRKVQLKMDVLATDLLAGLYRSAFKGRGMEFEEVREFQPGDEIRSIDWNVTARMGTPFIKQFREERELTVYLMLDISSSMNFSSQISQKRKILSEIASLIAFSGIKNQDKIGLILFSDIIEHHLPPAKGVRHALRLIRDLLAFSPQGKKTNFKNALHYLSEVQKKKCVLFLFSDFIEGGNFKKELLVLSKIHDILAIGIRDPLEKKIPKGILTHLMDEETGEAKVLDTTSSDFKPLNDQIEELKSYVQKIGGAMTLISTDEPYIKPLKKLFRARVK